MTVNIQREALLAPLQQIIGAVERRQTMPILGHVLMRCKPEFIELTATDLEVELTARIDFENSFTYDTTLPARKLFDICRNLPDNAELELSLVKDRISIRSGRSRFTLSTLKPTDFPFLDNLRGNTENFCLTQKQFKTMLDTTSFAMAQQDVRYYLNGLLLELTERTVKTVATDGHRLALYELEYETGLEGVHQVIIPRKGVIELQRILEISDEEIDIHLTTNHIQVNLSQLRFTSKLIDGRFPDYNRVIPPNTKNILLVDRISLKDALTRASILSNEKYKGVRLIFSKDSLRIQAHNPEQEEAEEEITVQYRGENIEIGFNVSYLLEILSVISQETIEIQVENPNSSALISVPSVNNVRYVIMPMKL